MVTKIVSFLAWTALAASIALLLWCAVENVL